MRDYMVHLIGIDAQGRSRTVVLVVEAATEKDAIDVAWEREWALMSRGKSLSIAREVLS